MLFPEINQTYHLPNNVSALSSHHHPTTPTYTLYHTSHHHPTTPTYTLYHTSAIIPPLLPILYIIPQLAPLDVM